MAKKETKKNKENDKLMKWVHLKSFLLYYRDQNIYLSVCCEKEGRCFGWHS
jgi:hypothetical protein